MARKKQKNKHPLFAGIPKELEKTLTAEYKKVIGRYQSSDFEHHETSVGKFCEVILRIFEYILTKKFTPIGKQISDTGKIINNLANNSGADVSLRTKVAPLVKILLGFRNERDAAHLGGVNLERIDTNFTFYATKWIYAELIRLYSDMDTKQIQQKIDESADIMFPDILKVGNKKVITDPRLTSEKEILLSLEDGDKTLEELFGMNKEQNKTRFKKKLVSMEKQKLIHRDDEGSCRLLPEGRKRRNKKPL